MGQAQERSWLDFIRPCQEGVNVKSAKDMILEDALKIAIEADRQNIKLKRIIAIQAVLIALLAICIMWR